MLVDTQQQHDQGNGDRHDILIPKLERSSENTPVRNGSQLF